jgi:hypothetical protein
MSRSDEPLFDPRVADWLEDDPFTAPDQAVDVVLAAFPSIKQRRALRVPWRFSRMNAQLRLGLAAAAVVVAVGGGIFLLAPRSAPPGFGAPAATATPTAAPTSSQSPRTTSSAAVLSIGTLTLTDSACTFMPSVDPLVEGVLVIGTTSQATTSSGIDLFKVRDGFTFADIQAHVDAENARIAKGEPYVGFPEAGMSINQLPLEPGASANLPFTATEGTYAVVCVRGLSESENPLAYYLVGPLEVNR